jgi:hypothetical protein
MGKSSSPLLAACLFICCGAAIAQSTFFVATDGADLPGNGSSASPWATIDYALTRVADASTILVRAGTYSGRVRLRGQFAQGVTVRSETPYRARLRNNATVITAYTDNVDIEGITLEGFDIAHSGPGAGALVVQIQDGFGAETRRITLRDNILHDSYNNDILKINNGASQIRVEGNLFYNQQGSDEHIDINSVEDVSVEDNVFFNDFAASGRSNANDTGSFVVIKDSNANDDEYLGARNVTVRRNVFLNWQGSPGSNFLLLGEDGTANFEAFDILVENNLFLGNSANAIRAPFGCKGCADIVFRANTTVGDLPGNAYAMRVNREGTNPTPTNLRFAGNLWADTAGSMNDFSDSVAGDVGSFALVRNGYWNSGNALPNDSADQINIGNDAAAVLGDPRLPSPAGAIAPAWSAASATFAGGYTTIRAAFEALAITFGMPQVGGAGVEAGSLADMPAEDLLGNARDARPDLGALERPDTQAVFRDGFE